VDQALELAFRRSPLAHVGIGALRRPAGATVYAAGEIGPITLLPACPDMASFRQAPYPPLADGVVRFVGQPIAACLAPTRAEAEELVAACHCDMSGLPAVPDMTAALAPDAPLLHPGWTDNRYAVGRVRSGDIASLAAPLRICRRVSLGRQSASPTEPRALLAVRFDATPVTAERVHAAMRARRNGRSW
jgi:carbon-monoxide dehydrogenase large subunit